MVRSENSPPIDAFSRILILLTSFFAIAALSLSIVGIATYSWYSSASADGTTQNYNLFVVCNGNSRNGSSICTEISRGTDFGRITRNASAFLVVGICLLGCAMLLILAMNFIRLSGILLFIAPIIFFLASLFILACLAEAARATQFNSYSAYLVETSLMSTIFCLGLSAFASGRLHVRYYERF